ncbi:F-box/WD repeat-containing protein 2-like [Portunus trituberculatus]|uniref:F-box/WD repeat-containing protein 2-like n=1 Tax=Portunus trituberculatus TaxID=210409 RepID=UPI001E1CCF93|nr:F-box/WD repeat-containing protein 2-like [Portunus trituberculatus]
MEKVRQQVEALGLQEQQQLIVDLITTSAPEVQLSLLVPSVTAAASYVKWRLVTNLQGQDTPDLLVLLPPELQLEVLLYLDGPSLLHASQVSKAWHSIIMNINEVWLKQCRRLGVNMSKVPGWADWHKVYITSLRQQVSLKNGTAFSERFMQLQNCKKAVKAVDYQDGFLCTVSEEDYINIWQLDMNIPVMTFPVERAVSCIKFHPNSLLLCGHFVGTLTSWDLSSMNQSRCTVWEHSSTRDHDNFKNRFKMHAGPVFSCDFSEELDLLVSGGADECLRLWCLSAGKQIKSLSNQDHWVLRVILIPDLSLTTKHDIVYMTRENVKKVSWPSNVKQDCEYDVPEKGVGSSASSSRPYGMIEKISDNFKISLNEGHTNFFTPGLQFSSKYIGIIKQDAEEKHANLCVFDIETFKLEHNISLNIKVKKLLALGNRYALLLTMGSVLYSSTLVIIDIVTTKIIGTRSIPHSKMTTPDGAQLVVGDVEWLNGLGVHLPGHSRSLSTAVQAENSNCATRTGAGKKYASQSYRIETSVSSMNTVPHGNTQCLNVEHNAVSCPKRKHKSDECCSEPCGGETAMDHTSLDASCCAHSDTQIDSDVALHAECAGDQCLMMDTSPEVKACQALEQPSFLVLAAGVLNEPGRLFTLWWAQSRHTHKCKKE